MYGRSPDALGVCWKRPTGGWRREGFVWSSEAWPGHSYLLLEVGGLWRDYIGTGS